MDMDGLAFSINIANTTKMRWKFPICFWKLHFGVFIHEISTFRCFYPWNIYGKMRWWYPILWIHISNNNMSAAANNFELKREIQSFHFNRELVAKSIFHRIKTNILKDLEKSLKNTFLLLQQTLASILFIVYAWTMRWLQESSLMSTGC